MEKESNSQISVVLDSKTGRFKFSESFELDIVGMELNLLTMLISDTFERMLKPNLEIFVRYLPEFYSDKLPFEIAYDKFTTTVSSYGFAIPETGRLKIHSNKLKQECQTAYDSYYSEHGSK